MNDPDQINWLQSLLAGLLIALLVLSIIGFAVFRFVTLNTSAKAHSKKKWGWFSGTSGWWVFGICAVIALLILAFTGHYYLAAAIAILGLIIYAGRGNPWLTKTLEFLSILAGAATMIGLLMWWGFSLSSKYEQPVPATLPTEMWWTLKVVDQNGKGLVTPQLYVKVQQLSILGVVFEYNVRGRTCAFFQELGQHPQQFGEWHGLDEKGYFQLDGWERPELYLSNWEKQGMTGKFWDNGEQTDKPARYTFFLTPSKNHR